MTTTTYAADRTTLLLDVFVEVDRIVDLTR
jgi:hypothetical protein